MTSLFHGLSAFPPTPADAEGIVDTRKLSELVDRLALAGVDSIGLLGSTGIYAYLDRAERSRALAAAVEAVAGRVPLIAGVGALRTQWSVELAQVAEAAGADGLLLAPMSYTPLTDAEVYDHYAAVAGATRLPLCIYNNPGTTHFTFSPALLARLSRVEGIAAVKMPLPRDGDFAQEIESLRAQCAPGFAIGYSGDWGCPDALLAGADAWYSVLGGILPEIALALTRAAQAGQQAGVAELNRVLDPLWSVFKTHGSLRVVYAIADELGLAIGTPPLPIQPLPPQAVRQVIGVIAAIRPLA